ncbi:MAG: argininosuccinate lyase [Methanobacteriota archaeon]|nr:MAG: argininosuccinate lyase [Euryarchaeota archaeon]
MGPRSKRSTPAPASDEFLRFTSSVAFDYKLWRYDIAGSLAHAHTLAEAGVITSRDFDKISAGLKSIAVDLMNGRFEFDSASEDLHMDIEKTLTERIGDAGAKLHTGRSRNDQVALDMRLYVRDSIVDLIERIVLLQETIVRMAAETTDVILPGYTHLQHGQPVLLSHHLLAYFWKLERDIERLSDCYNRTNVSPLGAGALAGTAFPIDRTLAAKMLRMHGVTENSLDSVSDRDFAAEAAFAASMLSIHLSSFCEELIMWSSQEFRFIHLPKELSGGSSMMPQKLNPDIPELIRGKSGRVLGGLVAILTLLKSLPLAYNRDLQEDKENLFDVFDTVGASLHALTHFLAELEFNEVRMRESAEVGLMTATDLADFLTTRGMPFRAAHGLVKELAELADGDDKKFRELAMDKLAVQSKKLESGDLDFLALEGSIEKRTAEGGTAPEGVAQQKEKATSSVAKNRALIKSMRFQTSVVDELLSQPSGASNSSVVGNDPVLDAR